MSRKSAVSKRGEEFVLITVGVGMGVVEICDQKRNFGGKGRLGQGVMTSCDA